MKKRVQITVTPVQVVADLNDTGTTEAIWQALPISGRVNLWGDEIYFSIPLCLELEDGKEVVQSGDLGYWPEGSAFCIFFGKTPVSLIGEIRPASAVNVFGRVLGDAGVFKLVKSGAKVTVEKVMSEQ